MDKETLINQLIEKSIKKKLEKIKNYGTQDKPLYLAKDITRLLKYRYPRNCIRKFNSEEKIKIYHDFGPDNGGCQYVFFLTKKGVERILNKRSWKYKHKLMYEYFGIKENEEK